MPSSLPAPTSSMWCSASRFLPSSSFYPLPLHACQNLGPDSHHPTFFTSSLSLLDTWWLSFSDSFSCCASSLTSWSMMVQFCASMTAWLVAFQASDSTRAALYRTTSCSSSDVVHVPGWMGGEFRSCWVVVGICWVCRISGGGSVLAEVTSVVRLTVNAALDCLKSLKISLAAI